MTSAIVQLSDVMALHKFRSHDNGKVMTVKINT